ncbi:hypothetical protein HWQ46_20175 [Shewanella sp. D64]|uniref:hypothetical protein n=1 Tax=unclassified Shewanella TaxID=196818 RepID=UPI0022BA3E67|nr:MULTISPECIES: hypothetical protein [unclassified Shewanella]MEC4727857.1 hypothetical protein [Shewanella sp. D64]MEC4739899.1 hypothetical protein [Shewanella sp. E94]WBJ97135.1 hypothetical protein HWQ47_08535 [Shewanella sp. MTB7]
MQELKDIKIEQVNGGFWPFVGGVAGGIVGNYIYESIGGSSGINSGFSAWGNWSTNRARLMQDRR